MFQNILEISVLSCNSKTTFEKFTVYGDKFVQKIVPEFLISQIFSIILHKLQPGIPMETIVKDWHGF